MRMQRKKPKVVRSLFSIVLLLAMMVQIFSVPVLAYEASSDGDGNDASVAYGDVNSDGAVNSTDVDLLARYLAADTSVTIDLVAADVDKNGSIDLNDLLYLVKYAKGDTNVSLGKTVTVTFAFGSELQPPRARVTAFPGCQEAENRADISHRRSARWPSRVTRLHTLT